jgi:hypothetical protein
MARTPADHLDLLRLAGIMVDPDSAHGGFERPADQGPAPDRVADPDEVLPGRNSPTSMSVVMAHPARTL